MRDRIRIHAVAFTPGSVRQRARGVLGFVTVSVNDALRVPGFTVLRLPGCRHEVCFPTKLDERRKHHAVIEPLSSAARRIVERQILDELRRQGELQ